MLLPHGVSAVESSKQAVQQDIAKTISVQNTQEERSDTFYLSNQEKPHSEILKMNFGNILKLYGKEK